MDQKPTIPINSSSIKPSKPVSKPKYVSKEEFMDDDNFGSDDDDFDNHEVKFDTVLEKCTLNQTPVPLITLVPISILVMTDQVTAISVERILIIK